MLRLASQRLLRLSLTTSHRHVRSFRTTVPILNAGPTKLHNILEDTNQSFVKIRGATAKGIEFEDGFLLPSSCICIDEQVFLWNVPSKLGKDERWEKKHFSLFEVVVPKPEILILGTGESVAQLPPDIKMYLNTLGIRVDVMDTWNACTTYNLLQEEGRRVAAALLPIYPLQWKASNSTSPRVE